MNSIKILTVTAALLVSGGVVQQAAAAGSSDPGQAFVERLESASTPVVSRTVSSVSGHTRVSAKDYYNLYEGAGRSQPQNLFRQTQGLGLAEMAGFGGVNNSSQR